MPIKINWNTGLDTSKLTLHRAIGLTLVAAALLWLDPCPDVPVRRRPTLTYGVTLPPLAGILREVVGDRGKVEVLTSGDASHTDRTDPASSGNVRSYVALFYVADELDGWARQLPAPHKIAVLALVPDDDQRFLLEEDNNPSPHGHDVRMKRNPCFWMDPLAVRAMLPGLVERLCALDPEGGKDYHANVDRFSRRLTQLNEEVALLLLPVEARPFIAYDAATSYLFARYGLKPTLVLAAHPRARPSRTLLEATVQAVRETGVRAIFVGPQSPEAPVKILGRATGIEPTMLDPFASTRACGAYTDLIRSNAQAIYEALK